MNRKKFLFDTNTLSSLTQQHDIHHEIILDKLSLCRVDDEFSVSIVSLYEMEYGARHAADAVLAHEMRVAIEIVQKRFPILPLTAVGAKIFADIKERYRQAANLGKKALIKHNVDLMITATALENQAIVVSNDHKIFAAIQNFHPDFQWEDWTQ